MTDPTRRDVLKMAGAASAAIPKPGAAAPSAGAWYATSYRKLFFDYHSHSTAMGLGSAFDAEGWARRLAEANAQAVSVFTKCGQGWSYYRKGKVRHVHPQLPSGLDMLEAQLAALHKRGLKAIGYYHTFNSEPVARDHPGWVIRDVKGTPQGQSICLLGPLLDEHLLPHVREIVSLYEVDAMFFDGTYASRACYCDSCRARFRGDTGLDLPEGEAAASWPRYVAWSLDRFRDVRRRISAAVDEARPGLPVSYNWVCSMRQPEAVPEHIGSLMIDVFPDDQAFNGSYQARYWATLERPFDIMNSAFLQWWGDWGSKPAQAMQQEVAAAIANGGLTWIGYQMTHTFDVQPAVMEQLGKTLAFVKEREPLLTGARPVPNVAVLHSASSHFSGGARLSADETATRGAHRILLESAIPHHFVNEAGLRKRLAEYRAVILPDARHLAPDLVSALEQYVENGGVLLATYRSGTEEADGSPARGWALERLLGLTMEGDCAQPEAYIEVHAPALKAGLLDMPLLVHGRFAFVRPAAGVEAAAGLRKVYLRADGKYLLRSSPPGDDSGYPAITRRRVGKGTAIYIAGQVFRGYQTHNQWCLKPLIANLLNGAIPHPLVRLHSPAWLEVSLMRQGSRTIAHLVNHHGNRPSDRNNLCVEQVLPVHGVTLELASERRPAGVRLEPGGLAPQWEYAGGFARITIPRVHIHSAVVMS
ncbi:MAG: beta-galactosidase trimerization domain-containing protein [Bryobacterales bacterium]|nr:beta-galactosidase trimerization domain-containing protein [Bryobacterales bacterium]